jgi:predicted Zn-dependent protease
MEATEPPSTVLAYYDQLLKAEPTNIAVWKRRISVLRRLGSIDKAVEELNKLLDTFYTDLEGWLELADLYSSCNQYVSHRRGLSEMVLHFF